QRRLPAPRRPHEHHELPVRDRQVDAVDRDDAVGEDLGGRIQADPAHVRTPALLEERYAAASRSRSRVAPASSAAMRTAPTIGSTVVGTGTPAGTRATIASRISGEGWRRTPPERTSGKGLPSSPTRAAEMRAYSPSRMPAVVTSSSATGSPAAAS